jgi:integrase
VSGSASGRSVRTGDARRKDCNIREDGLADVRIHDLRHTFASGGLLVGEGLAMIGKSLGHTQVQTTARYAHLESDPVKQAATRISDRLALTLLGAIDKPSGKAQQFSTSIDNEADDAAAA